MEIRAVPTERTTASAEGDADFAEVFSAHRTAVFRLAVLLTGDRHVADEITAEVFARTLPRWRRDVIREPLAYLRRAVVNEVRTRHRRGEREARALSRAGVDDEHVDVDRLALAEPLVAALGRLPVRQRAVVVLRFHDDLSEADVARTLGMAPGTVKSHASRGLEQLRSLLEETR
jgi:RNA polymerase sigma-70 factor (sigma-E family)